MSDLKHEVAAAIRKVLATRHHGLPKGGWDGLMNQAAEAAIKLVQEKNAEPTTTIME